MKTNVSCKFRFVVCVFISMMIGLTAFAQTTIKLGHLAPTNDPRHEALEHFAAIVAERTGGEVEIVLYPDSTLGSERELFEQVSSGITEMALIGGIVSNFYPQFAIVDMPYLWETQDELQRFLSSSIANEWRQEMIQQSNVGIAGFFDRNPRVLVTRNTPVHSMADLAGLKIRVPEIRSALDTWRAFGVQPTPMPASEFYQGLNLGVIDGMENPVEVHANWSIYEVANYLSVTEHQRAILYLIYNDAVLNSLSDENRQIVLEAAAEATEMHNEMIREMEQEMYTILEERGMTIVQPDRTEFIEASRSVWETYAPEFGEDVLQRVQDGDF